MSKKSDDKNDKDFDDVAKRLSEEAKRILLEEYSKRKKQDDN